MSSFKAGDIVNSPYGQVKIKEIRAAVTTPKATSDDDTKPATTSKSDLNPTASEFVPFNAVAVAGSSAAEVTAKDVAAVTTREKTETANDSRSDVIVAEPTYWSMAKGQVPTFYLSAKDCKALTEDEQAEKSKAKASDDTEQKQEKEEEKGGEGEESKDAKEKPEIVKESEKILNAAKTIYTMNNEEKFKKAEEIKASGNDMFASGEFDKARVLYEDALRHINFLQLDTTQTKARAFSFLIPLYNNIGVCRMKEKNWKEALVGGQSAVELCDLLDSDRMHSDIMLELVVLGKSRRTILQDWRGKGYRTMVKSLYYKQEHDKCCEVGAMAMVTLSPSNEAVKEISKFLQLAKKKAGKAKQKAARMWQGAFEKNTNGEEGVTATTTAAAATTTTAAAGTTSATATKASKTAKSTSKRVTSAAVAAAANGSLAKDGSNNGLGDGDSSGAGVAGGGGGGGGSTRYWVGCALALSSVAAAGIAAYFYLHRQAMATATTNQYKATAHRARR